MTRNEAFEWFKRGRNIGGNPAVDEISTEARFTRLWAEPKLEIKHKFDMGAVDIKSPKTITIALRIEYNGRHYRVDVADDQSATVVDIESATAVDCNTGISQMLIGYALRRVICRGIDKADLHETQGWGGATVIEINLGKLGA
jgi:hypothetical protein